MKTIHLNAIIGDDGLLKIETPTDYKNISAEVIVVIQPANNNKTSNGYPIDFFESIDAIEADDLIERPFQGIQEDREPLE